MIPGDMLTEAQRRCIPDVSFELIPIRNLVSNQEYQRPLSENHIRKALEEFDVYQINPVKVSRRDGINYVFDGQHTIEIIASESGSRDTPVWCMIYDDLKYKEEAHIFADQQKHVKALSSFETFKAHIEADDPKQKMIEAIVQSYGLAITSTKAKNSISAVSTLERIYDKYGQAVLDTTLRLAIATWEGENNSLSGSILMGIARIVVAYGDSLKEDVFKDHVGRVSVKAIIRAAKERRPGALGYSEAMIIEYNKKSKFRLSLKTLYLDNSYIVPCDIWCDRNPFHRHELYSWYMVSDLVDNESNVRVNRKMELVAVPEASGGNAMIGICYLGKDDADIVERRIEELCKNKRYDSSFWEEALYQKDRMIVAARVVHSTDIVEINTYEQLREIDSDSNQLKTDAIQVICKALDAKSYEITDITVLKKGMTNRSFLFTCKGKKYIMRIPGEGTDQLINRRQEAEVYHTIDSKKICDDIAYINPENGYKITEFLEEARVCDPLNYEDVKKCMKRLRAFHELKLKVNHEFDIFGQIEFYESLWDGAPSVYKDYGKTKANVLSLKPY